ncbi:MAG: aminoacetone oxidase family FAD-binding enzyme, partial [Firmicutes bacterium]|nr:aminoacetone oxidase family FAD-binding enzyme [Bacillota bacterium]
MRKQAHETIYEVVVIGGGASGMMAAISAKSQLPEGDVLLLERNEILGRKLLATGNGRCNFTNTLALPMDYGTSAEFTKPAMEAMNPLHVIQVFDSMGILYRVEEEGRVYPHSGQGATVTQALERKLEQLGVKVKKSAVVEEVTYSTKFDIRLKNGKVICADKLILATGGKAGGQFGCQGDGYTFAKGFGHEMVKIRPALVAVNCKTDEAEGRDAWKKDWKGVRSQARVSLWKVPLNGEEETCVAEDRGEVQFTDSGLSGICVFNLSRHIVFTGNMKDGRNETYMIEVDFLPDWTEEKVLHMLERRRDALADYDADSFLMSVVHNKLINGLLEQVGFKGLTIVLDGVEEKTWPDLKTITDEQLAKL